ncbi:unnamed protein product [Ixodes persulcatus]
MLLWTILTDAELSALLVLFHARFSQNSFMVPSRFIFETVYEQGGSTTGLAMVWTRITCLCCFDRRRFAGSNQCRLAILFIQKIFFFFTKVGCVQFYDSGPLNGVLRPDITM